MFDNIYIAYFSVISYYICAFRVLVPFQLNDFQVVNRLPVNGKTE